MVAVMELDYNLAKTVQAKKDKKHKKNADHLSIENPGHSFQGPATASLRQLSFGAGSGNRLGTRRKCPMGIVRPRRVAPPPPGGIPAQHPAPSPQKMNRLPLISWLFRLVDCFSPLSPGFYAAKPAPVLNQILLGQALVSIPRGIDVTLIIGRGEANLRPSPGTIAQRRIDNIEAHQHQVNAMARHSRRVVIVVIVVILVNSGVLTAGPACLAVVLCEIV